MSNGYGFGYGYWGPYHHYGGWGSNINNPITNKGPGTEVWNVGRFSGSNNYGTAPGSVNSGVAVVGGHGGSVTNAGPGAGGYNAGAFSGSINNPSGPINFK